MFCFFVYEKMIDFPWPFKEETKNGQKMSLGKLIVDFDDRIGQRWIWKVENEKKWVENLVIWLITPRTLCCSKSLKVTIIIVIVLIITITITIISAFSLSVSQQHVSRMSLLHEHLYSSTSIFLYTSQFQFPFPSLSFFLLERFNIFLFETFYVFVPFRRSLIARLIYDKIRCRSFFLKKSKNEFLHLSFFFFLSYLTVFFQLFTHPPLLWFHSFSFCFNII